MNTEFNWWLLIVGIVVGARLVWLVLADVRRREDEVGKAERRFEAVWIADTLRSSGTSIEPDTAEQVLDLHQVYLSSLPPDEAPMEGVDEGPEPGVAPEADEPIPATDGSSDQARTGESAVGRRTERPA